MRKLYIIGGLIHLLIFQCIHPVNVWVQVQLPAGKRCSISLPAGSTARDLKDELQKQVPLKPLQYMRLIHMGRDLDDKTTLENDTLMFLVLGQLKTIDTIVQDTIKNITNTYTEYLAYDHLPTELHNRSCTWLLANLTITTQELIATLGMLKKINLTEENRGTLETLLSSSFSWLDNLRATSNTLHCNLPIYATFLKDPAHAEAFYDLVATAPEAAKIIFRPTPTEFSSIEAKFFENINETISKFKHYNLYRKQPIQSYAKLARFFSLATHMNLELSKKIDVDEDHGQIWFHISSHSSQSTFDTLKDIGLCAQYPGSAACKALSARYKIHLMPREHDLEHAYLILLNAIITDRDFRESIHNFKVLCNNEESLEESGAPKIVIYCTGKKSAQFVLDHAYKLFATYANSGCTYRPAFNEKVTNFLYFAQGDRDYKQSLQYAQYFEHTDDKNTNMVYYNPTFIGIPKSEYTLKNPAHQESKKQEGE